MHCEKSEMLLAQSIYGELDAAGPEGAELAAHLAGCKPCAELLNDMRVAAGLLREGLSAGPAPVLSAERHAVLLNKAAEISARRMTDGRRAGSVVTRNRIIGGAVAAAAAVVLAGMLLPATMSVREHARRAPAPKCPAPAYDEVILSADVVRQKPAEYDPIKQRDIMARNGGPDATPAPPPAPRTDFPGPTMELLPEKTAEAPRLAVVSGKPDGKPREEDAARWGGRQYYNDGTGKDKDEVKRWTPPRDLSNRLRQTDELTTSGSVAHAPKTPPAGPTPQPEPAKLPEQPAGPRTVDFAKKMAELQVAEKDLKDLIRREKSAGIEKPVVVNGKLESKDHFETDNAMDKRTGRGTEDAIGDIPLGGTGTVGTIGVGGGGMAQDKGAKRPEASPKSGAETQKELQLAKLQAENEKLRMSLDDDRKAKNLKGEAKIYQDTRIERASTMQSIEDASVPYSKSMVYPESWQARTARELVTGQKTTPDQAKAPEVNGKIAGPKPFIVLTPEQAQALYGQQGQSGAQNQGRLVPDQPPEKPPVKTDPEGAEPALSPAAVFKVVPVNPFVMAAKDRFSTFGLDVDTASYSIARRYIRGGYLPPVGAVRMEEFVNTFDYNYPCRTSGTFSVISEAAPAPFGQDLTLLKVGIRGKVIGREGRKPAHLVFVVDASGSMDQPDRMPLVKYALGELVGQLSANDRVTLVAYGTKARLMLDGAAASDKKAILDAIDRVQCEGSTNLSEGLSLGYRLAAQGFIPGGINRVILCSDGAANIGITAGESILDQVKAFRDKGVTCTSVGFGAGTYNDVLLEKLADSGDGSYVFVDSKREARRVFVEELSATLQTIAKDAKIQVEFDPRRVRRYRLVGYENRDIADEKFRDDTVDAGEVGSGQSATALYELELQGAPDADLGTVYIRYRNVDTGRVEEISQRLEGRSIQARTPESDPRFYLAACAAEFAELLRESEHAAGGSFDALQSTLERVAAQPALRGNPRVLELLDLVRKAKGLPRAG